MHEGGLKNRTRHAAGVVVNVPVGALNLLRTRRRYRGRKQSPKIDEKNDLEFVPADKRYTYYVL